MEPMDDDEDEDEEMINEETQNVISQGSQMGEILKTLQQSYELIVPSNMMISL